MKSYLLLIHLLYSLPAVSSDTSERIPLLSTSGSLSESILSDGDSACVAASSRGASSGLAQSSVTEDDSRRCPSTSPAMTRRSRYSNPVPIPNSQARSPQLSDYFDQPPRTVAQAQPPRRTLFEPHLRRIEEDFIRQLTFKIRVRKHTTEENCIKITIEGFLRDKRMMKQTVDIEY